MIEVCGNVLFVVYLIKIRSFANGVMRYFVDILIRKYFFYYSDARKGRILNIIDEKTFDVCSSKAL